jgi:glycosyltransferase involved in cell wall biosynthesis
VLKPYIDIELDEKLEKGWLREMPISRAEKLVKSGKVEYENIEPKTKYSVSVIIPVYNQEDLIKRCIDSIPSGVEVIVVDDCSTDKTREVVKQYKNVKLICNEENKGVGYTYNRGLDEATGDYIVRIDSDDYFYTGQFNHMLEELDGNDMIYYNLEDNNGRILEVTPRNRHARCGAVKFIRRKFIGDTRCPEIRTAEDKAFNNQLLDKMPTEKFTGRIVYHYNYPRENSLTDLTKRGLI